MVELVQIKYDECNYTFLNKLLGEAQRFFCMLLFHRAYSEVSRYPQLQKYRPHKPHYRRSRKLQVGMLVQIDGSHQTGTKAGE